MYFLVTTVHGPGRDEGRGIRGQDGGDAHAAFMDSLVTNGHIVLGGPVGTGERTAHLFEAADAARVRARWADDPRMVD